MHPEKRPPEPPPDITVRLVSNPLLRQLLLVCGFFFAFLAMLGAILPVLPTTPFLLASAACFYRSSERFYKWIMYNRLFGQYLRDYRAGKGVPLLIKVLALSFMWASTLVSVFLFIPYLWLEATVIAISAAVTLHIVLIRKRR